MQLVIFLPIFNAPYMHPKIRCDRYCAKKIRSFWPSKRGLYPLYDLLLNLTTITSSAPISLPYTLISLAFIDGMTVSLLSTRRHWITSEKATDMP
jgi:hypothetical protein